MQKGKYCTNQKLKKDLFNLSKFLRIIGDNNRIKILCLLKEGEKCVCEIYPRLNIAQNLVSSHLKVMFDFGLLNVRQDWKKNYYSVNKKTLKKYNDLLNNLLEK